MHRSCPYHSDGSKIDMDSLWLYPHGIAHRPSLPPSQSQHLAPKDHSKTDDQGCLVKSVCRSRSHPSSTCVRPALHRPPLLERLAEVWRSKLRLRSLAQGDRVCFGGKGYGPSLTEDSRSRRATVRILELWGFRYGRLHGYTQEVE